MNGINNLPTKLALRYHPKSSLINNILFIYLLLLVFDARIYKPVKFSQIISLTIKHIKLVNVFFFRSSFDQFEWWILSRG